MTYPHPHSALRRDHESHEHRSSDSRDLSIAAYAFDGFRVDLSRFCVTRNGEPIKIEPKAFEVLVYLIERRERVVEKRELLDTLWADSFVTDNALTRVIAHLRKALSDAATVKHIETVHKRGYRFVAEVAVETERPVRLPVVATPSTVTSIDARAVGTRRGGPLRPRRIHLAAAATVLALLAGTAAAVRTTSDRVGPVDSIAVLPLVAHKAGSSSVAVSEGIAASLNASLSRHEGLEVASHSAVFHLGGEVSDPVAVGRELGVSTVFAGRYIERDGTLILKVQLVDVNEGRQIWSGHYERSASDLVVVQEQISRDVFEALRLDVDAPDARISA